MSKADELKGLTDQLELTDDDRLQLGPVAMVLMPRWFFVGIMRRVIDRTGLETASAIYYDAGWEGAYNWNKAQMDLGLEGRAVMEQYLGSMTTRGWGRFEIKAWEPDKGRGEFLWHNSAPALEMNFTGQPICLWGPGAMAGGMQAIIDAAGLEMKVVGREVDCLSAGADRCRIVVEPE